MVALFSKTFPAYFYSAAAADSIIAISAICLKLFILHFALIAL